MSEVKGIIKGKLVDVGVTTGYLMEWDADGKKIEKRERIGRVPAYIQKGAVVEHTELVDGQLIFDGNFYRALPIVTTKYKIVDDVKREDGVTVGYDLCTVGSEDSTCRVSIFTAWKLAADNCIEDVEAHVVRGSNKKILIRINRDK